MKATAVYQGGGSAGLINQDGTVNATALVNEHNRRNGRQKSPLQGNGQTVIIKNNKTNPDRSEKDGSTDTDILEGRKVSASGRGKNRIRTHGANTEIIRRALGNVHSSEGNNDISLAAGETAWLSSPDFGPAQKMGGGLGESFLRNIRRVKSNGFDSIGRILSPELQEKISDTVFMEEDGTVNATALVNEHNRRNGSQKSVDKTTANKYNDVRGERYVTTDEFRGLQEASRGMSDEDIQLYHSGNREIDAGLRENISRILRTQINYYRNGVRNDNGILSLNAKGNQFNIYENVDGFLFHDIFEIARNYLKNGELVDLHTIETTEDGVGYNDCYNYLSEDGLSGFSITPDGDLISVFNASSKGGFLGAIAPIVKARAKTLDCYNSPNQPLMGMYSKIFGFKTASIMEYNMDFDHDNIAQNHNKPKIAFMVNTEADVETKEFSKDEYDEAVAYRNSFVEKADSDNGSAFSVDENQKVNSKRVNREKKITPKEEEIVRRVGKALGLEVEFKDLGWADGKITGNKVTINIYAINPVRAVIKHEFTHSFESSKHYSKFQQYVTRNSKAFKQWLKENGFETTAQAIKETQERYTAQGEDLTYPEAKAEVIADFVGDKLFNKGANITDSITEDFLSELARADRNLFERFAEWIESLVKRLKGTAVEKDIVKLEQMVKRLKETTDTDQAQNRSLTGQSFKDGKAAGKVTVSNAIPLSEKYHSEAVARFAKNPDADIRYSIPRDKKITPGMSESERYEILKDRTISIAVANTESKTLQNTKFFNGLLKKTEAKKLLRRIGDEFSIFKDYENTDI